jgi:hypothetical protein
MNPYAGFRYPAEIIIHAVWLYHRFTLSFREVEEILAERGIVVSHETIRQWQIVMSTTKRTLPATFLVKFAQIRAEVARARHRLAGQHHQALCALWYPRMPLPSRSSSAVRTLLPVGD